MKRLRLLNTLALIALCLNMVLNLAFIPQHGALGAAWAAGITQAFFCLNCIWFSRGELEALRFGALLRILVAATLCALLALLLHGFGWVWYIQVSVALGAWLWLLISGKLHPDLHVKQFLSGRGA